MRHPVSVTESLIDTDYRNRFPFTLDVTSDGSATRSASGSTIGRTRFEMRRFLQPLFGAGVTDE